MGPRAIGPAFAPRTATAGMTASQNPTLFNRSSLIRYFTDQALVVDAQPAFAQGMAQWVGFTDAMTLYTALEYRAPAQTGASVAGTCVQAASHGAAYRTACAELARVRETTVAWITRGCATTAGAARIKFPVPQSGTALEIAVMYTPFHRFILSLQREMETRVAPLRAAVRVSMAATSPHLRKLAMLDAALDGIVSERERRVLACVPQLLEKRFKQLLQAHQQALEHGGQTDDLSTWMQAGAWLAQFRDELREVVLGEWDVRLQPVMGLVAAFSNEVKQST
ncbi:MAG: hypothetical protein RIR09_1802 [Pseudomonadota bacterium]